MFRKAKFKLSFRHAVLFKFTHCLHIDCNFHPPLQFNILGCFFFILSVEVLVKIQVLLTEQVYRFRKLITVGCQVSIRFDRLQQCLCSGYCRPQSRCVPRWRLKLKGELKMAGNMHKIKRSNSLSTVQNWEITLTQCIRTKLIAFTLKSMTC